MRTHVNALGSAWMIQLEFEWVGALITYPNTRPELEYSFLASVSSRFCLFRTVIVFKVKQSHIGNKFNPL